MKLLLFMLLVCCASCCSPREREALQAPNVVPRDEVLHALRVACPAGWTIDIGALAVLFPEDIFPDEYRHPGWEITLNTPETPRVSHIALALVPKPHTLVYSRSRSVHSASDGTAYIFLPVETPGWPTILEDIQKALAGFDLLFVRGD